MNPHANMQRQINPDQDERITLIVDREGGPRQTDTLTVTCCGHTYTGTSEDALAWSVQHRRTHHPRTLRPRKNLARKTADKIGRANGTRISAQQRRGETT